MKETEHPLSPRSHKDTTDDEGENASFERSRSLSLQSRRSWPLLPKLQLINSNESNGDRHQSIRSPVIDNFDKKSIASSDSVSSESSIASDYVDGEKYQARHSESDVEEEEQLPTSSSGRRPTLKSSGRNDSAGTLVEAALDQAEARDRHVQFSAHIAEAGSLVQRMLSTKYPSSSVGTPTASVDHTTIHEVPESHHSAELSQLEKQSNHLSASSYNNNAGGGSVLASLMKLEAQKRQPSIKRQKTTKKKKVPKKKAPKIRKPASMYNFQAQSSVDALNPDMGQPPGLKRPGMTHRPSSWLSTVTTNNHLVPSLQKRKQAASVNMSRRSSMDSMFTTASQFEPITLEDRIRITFEIANILQKQEFLRKLVKCLMLYGAPAHRLEYILRHVSKTLGVDAEYVYIPNVMFLTFFDQSTHTTETHFIRCAQGFDMHKLGEVYRLEKLVSHGEVSVDEALEFIDKVTDEPQFYPIWLNPLVYATASFCGCVMFYGGSWKDGGLSAALAIFFALYELFSGRYMSFQPIWEITVCILIGFVARALWNHDFCFTPVAFASFIVILPGYSMAVALVELVSRQLVCGVVRLVYTIIYSFLLGYGIEMGSEIFGTIEPNSLKFQSDRCESTNNVSMCGPIQPFYALLVPLFAVAYCIYLKARLPRWPVMIFVAICGFVVNWALSCRVGSVERTVPTQVLQVVPAFTVGLLGNLLSKFTSTMSLDAVILGIFYLVPGSLGLKAALGFFGSADNSEFARQGGASFALSMIETSIGITIGLFIATLIVYPKGTQHTPLMNF